MLKGGGRNPHAALFRLITSYSSGELTKAKALAKIDVIKDGWRRRITLRGFTNFLELLGARKLQLLPSRTWLVQGPTKHLSVKATPHLTVRVDGQVWNICLWNNEKPELDFDTGAFGPALMMEAANDEGVEGEEFVLLNLTVGKLYSMDWDRLERRRLKTHGLLETLDAAVKRIEEKP
jgi:hypothetical protein